MAKEILLRGSARGVGFSRAERSRSRMLEGVFRSPFLAYGVTVSSVPLRLPLPFPLGGVHFSLAIVAGLTPPALRAPCCRSAFGADRGLGSHALQFWGMVAKVLSPREQFQVAGIIVLAIMVAMVDMLGGEKIPADNPAHDYTMLQRPVGPRQAHLDVPIAVPHLHGAQWVNDSLVSHGGITTTRRYVLSSEVTHG